MDNYVFNIELSMTVFSKMAQDKPVSNTENEEEVPVPANSILNFPRQEALDLEKKTLGELTAVQILKYLVAKSEQEATLNPCVRSQCGKTLRMLNSEKLHPTSERPPRRENNGGPPQGRKNEKPWKRNHKPSTSAQ